MFVSISSNNDLNQRAAEPVGAYPDPDPNFGKKLNSATIFERKIRMRDRRGKSIHRVILRTWKDMAI